MSKRYWSRLTIVCVVCLCIAIFSGFKAATGKDESGAQYTEIPLYVDGILVGAGRKVDATTYIPFRAFCQAMDKEASVTWDEKSMTAMATMEQLTLSATIGKNYMMANDRALILEHGVKKMDGTLMVPVRELAKAFGVPVVWNAADWSVSLSTSEIVPILSGAQFYVEEDLYWLSRIIYAESGNQPFEGMIAVGNVVLNRVKDPSCPNTVKDVIFDTKNGVQFHPVTSSIIYGTPSDEAVIAAKVCLEGYNNIGNSLFFLNPTISEPSSVNWFRQNKTFVAAIGEHEFYA